MYLIIKFKLPLISNKRFASVINIKRRALKSQVHVLLIITIQLTIERIHQNAIVSQQGHRIIITTFECTLLCHPSRIVSLLHLKSMRGVY